MADKQQTPAAAPATGTDTATDSDTTAAERKKEVQAYFGATAQNYVASVRHASGWDLHRLVELCECAPDAEALDICLLYTSPSPRDRTRSRMPSSA